MHHKNGVILIVIRNCILLTALGGSLSAAEILFKSGHRLKGEIVFADAEYLQIRAQRFELQRAVISSLSIEDAPVDTMEFFGKLQLKDGTEVVGQIRQAANGDVVILGHPILGDNYAVKQASIKKLTAAGEARIQVADLGEISGFITAENPERLLVESVPGFTIKVLKSALREYNGSEKAGEKKAKPESMYIGVLSGVGLVAGNLRPFVTQGYHAGAEYGYRLAGRFAMFGSAILTGQFEKFQDEKLTITYYRLYAGVRRFFSFGGAHSIFAKLSAGLNNEQIKGARAFSESVVVGGFSAGWGYALKVGAVTLLAENFVGYVFDSSNPLVSLGIEVGVLYGF